MSSRTTAAGSILCAMIGLGANVVGQAADAPRKPRVLLIGDSISIGYTPAVTKLLEAEAEVVHHPGNAENTRNGLKQLDGWLKDGPFDAIHFNWGLWDLRDGGQAVPLEEYDQNLRALVGKLQATKAKLVWASITPVPQGAALGRRDVDVLAYNAAAQKIMDERKILIDDLYAFAKPRLNELQQPKNVHFSKDGSAELAKPVAESIRKVLAAR
jgi:lysophospholipase L1-like esterase